MSPKLNLRRSLALTTALVVTAFGAAPAMAYDPGNGNNNGQSQSQSADTSDKGGKKDQGEKSGGGQGSKDQGGTSGSKGSKDQGGTSGSKGSKDQGGTSGSKGSKDQGGTSGSKGSKDKGDKGSKGDPAGNNGTVKITPIGQDDGIPQNNPHVPCGFDIEWYGFDEGDDIVSTVSLVPHAPTSDVTMTMGGPASVFVGGDPASGAGTDSGFDGEATYYPTFTGEPHPKQGYHVKLTIHTPGSQGADTKHKVFWVQPCEDEAPATEECPDGTMPDADGECDETDLCPNGTMPGADGECDETDLCPNGTMPGADGECDETDVCPDGTMPGADGECGDVEGTQEEDDDDDSTTTVETDGGEVAGTQASAGSGSEVPSAVDAGDEGNPVVNAITSPLGLVLLLGGLAVAGAALIARRQTN